MPLGLGTNRIPNFLIPHPGALVQRPNLAYPSPANLSTRQRARYYYNKKTYYSHKYNKGSRSSIFRPATRNKQPGASIITIIASSDGILDTGVANFQRRGVNIDFVHATFRPTPNRKVARAACTAVVIDTGAQLKGSFAQDRDPKPDDGPSIGLGRRGGEQPLMAKRSASAADVRWKDVCSDSDRQTDRQTHSVRWLRPSIALEHPSRRVYG
ncbi:hypothetical protein LX36DRAFT_699032 [Colletotrichum falcatum]|nr:hypothetical protein LX36DRAFT_699032 [Colletotrichum falcatum]